ncbi:MAG: hypothetical protein ACJAYF_003064 [Arenicella sp.]|jgi:hypothetical protein
MALRKPAKAKHHHVILNSIEDPHPSGYNGATTLDALSRRPNDDLQQSTYQKN